MCFFVITKNLRISKDVMRIRMKNVSIMGFQKSEIIVFREEFRKIQYIGRYCLKRGGMNRLLV